MTNEAGFKLLELEYSEVPKNIRDLNHMLQILIANKHWAKNISHQEIRDVYVILNTYTWNLSLRNDDICLWETIVTLKSYSHYVELAKKKETSNENWTEGL